MIREDRLLAEKKGSREATPEQRLGETKVRSSRGKHTRRGKETEGRGGRLCPLLLQPEGGWSAGWDRTRWLVARQPDFLSLSLSRQLSLSSFARCRSLCPSLPDPVSVPYSALLAFALNPPRPDLPLADVLTRSHRRRSSPGFPLLLALSGFLCVSLSTATRHPLHLPERSGFPVHVCLGEVDRTPMHFEIAMLSRGK